MERAQDAVRGVVSRVSVCVFYVCMQGTGGSYKEHPCTVRTSHSLRSSRDYDSGAASCICLHFV